MTLVTKAVKFSIITPTLNRLDFLKTCIHSVLDQDYQHVEHVVVDGASTDGTIEFLESATAHYADRIRWVSRPDDGISQAVNTGFAMATGDVLGWIGSDDGLSEGTLRLVAQYFEKHPEAQWLYGSFLIVDGNGHKIRLVRAKEFNYRRFVHSGYISPPSVFARRELVQAVGPVREDLKYSMDYEWCLRLAAIATPHRLSQCLAYFGWHRASITSGLRLAQLDEGMRISQAYARGKTERAWIAAAYTFYKVRAWAWRRLLRVSESS